MIRFLIVALCAISMPAQAMFKKIVATSAPKILCTPGVCMGFLGMFKTSNTIVDEMERAAEARGFGCWVKDVSCQKKLSEDSKKVLIAFPEGSPEAYALASKIYGSALNEIVFSYEKDAVSESGLGNLTLSYAQFKKLTRNEQEAFIVRLALARDYSEKRGIFYRSSGLSEYYGESFPYDECAVYSEIEFSKNLREYELEIDQQVTKVVGSNSSAISMIKKLEPCNGSARNGNCPKLEDRIKKLTGK